MVPARLLADASGIYRTLVDAKSCRLVIYSSTTSAAGGTFRDAAGRAEDPGSLVHETLFARRGRAETPPQLVLAKGTAGAKHVVLPWEMGKHRREVSPRPAAEQAGARWAAVR